MEKETKGLIRQLGKLTLVGTEIVAGTFVGLAIGIYLDKLFETSPLFTIIFLLVGIAAGFLNMFREIKRLDN